MSHHLSRVKIARGNTIPFPAEIGFHLAEKLAGRRDIGPVRRILRRIRTKAAIRDRVGIPDCRYRPKTILIQMDRTRAKEFEFCLGKITGITNEFFYPCTYLNTTITIMIQMGESCLMSRIRQIDTTFI